MKFIKFTDFETNINENKHICQNPDNVKMHKLTLMSLWIKEWHIFLNKQGNFQQDSLKKNV